MTKYVSLDVMRGGTQEHHYNKPYISVYNGGGARPYYNTCMWISVSQYLIRVLGIADASVQKLRDINGLVAPRDNGVLFDTGIREHVQGMMRIAQEYDLTINVFVGGHISNNLHRTPVHFSTKIGRGSNHVHIVCMRSSHYELIVYAESLGVDLRSRFIGFTQGGPGATEYRRQGKQPPKITATSRPLTTRLPVRASRGKKSSAAASATSAAPANTGAAAAGTHQGTDTGIAIDFSRQTQQEREAADLQRAIAASMQPHNDAINTQVPLTLHQDTERAIDVSRQTQQEREAADLQRAIAASVQPRNDTGQVPLTLHQGTTATGAISRQAQREQEAIELQRAMEASRQSHQESVMRRAQEASLQERDEALAREMQGDLDLEQAQRESADAELARQLQQQYDGTLGGTLSETDSLEVIGDLLPLEYVDVEKKNEDDDESSGCVIS